MGVRRATLSEAAQLLDISKGAVRQRARRGTLRSDKGEDGRVYVYVDESMHGVQDGATGDSTGRYVGSLEDQVEYLRDQLDQERTASAELRRIIAGLTQRIPELEAPSSLSDATESPQTASTDAGRVGPPDRGKAPQEGTQQRPWWRRIFGG